MFSINGYGYSKELEDAKSVTFNMGRGAGNEKSRNKGRPNKGLDRGKQSQKPKPNPAKQIGQVKGHTRVNPKKGTCKRSVGRTSILTSFFFFFRIPQSLL